MSALLDMILNGVGVVGNVLDTPGALVRNTLSGRNPFSGLNPFDAEGRASGRDMLESWGALDQNQEGLDWGDAAGFGAELLTDPLNLIGAGAARNTAKAAKGARAANAGIDAAKDIVRAAPSAASFFPAGERADEAIEAATNLLRYHGSDSVFRNADRIVFGTQDEAASALAKALGYDLDDPSRAVQKVFATAPAAGYSLANDAADVGFGGMVLPGIRGDISFLANDVERFGQSPFAVAAHELAHNQSAMRPDGFRKMQAAIGDLALNAGWNDYYATAPRGARTELDKLSPVMQREEGTAKLIDRTVASKVFNNPALLAIDMAARKPQDSSLYAMQMGEEFGRLMDQVSRAKFGVGLNEPAEAGGYYTRFAANKMWDSMDGPAQLFGGDLLSAAKAGSDIPSAAASHLPMDMMSVLPAYHDIPSNNPLLAALLGYNATTGVARAQ